MSELPLLVVVDDEPEIVASIKRTLMRVDVTIESFTSPRLALAFIKENEPAIVLTDQRMPDISGLELLKETQDIWPNTKRIMLSAYQDFDDIAEGFNEKVIEHFVSKPWKNVEIQLLISDNAVPNKAPKIAQQLSHSIIGDSSEMQSLMANVSKAAGANAPVFIHGETGTGKELIARSCHELGVKRQGPFVAVNCANFSESLIESQLFGHKKGAFTGAIADQEGIFSQGNNGTIFLDEITTLPLNLQSKLLRVIQERCFAMLGSMEMLSFDAQIVSASSTALSEAVANGDFREDLFYRLNVIPLRIPPLRNRGQDAVLLANHFMVKFSQAHHKSFDSFSQDAIDFLTSYRWPGNVRQLENLMHSTCIMNDSSLITLAMLEALLVDIDLSKEAQNIERNGHITHSNHQSNQLSDASDEVTPLHIVEKEAIEQAIQQCNGSVTKAAAMLEVNPSTLYRKIKSWS